MDLVATCHHHFFFWLGGLHCSPFLLLTENIKHKKKIYTFTFPQNANATHKSSHIALLTCWLQLGPGIYKRNQMIENTMPLVQTQTKQNKDKTSIIGQHDSHSWSFLSLYNRLTFDIFNRNTVPCSHKTGQHANKQLTWYIWCIIIMFFSFSLPSTKQGKSIIIII